VRLEATQAPLLNREPEFADHPQTGRAPNMPESSKMTQGGYQGERKHDDCAEYSLLLSAA
jgi:hypothetical protein